MLLCAVMRCLNYLRKLIFKNVLLQLASDLPFLLGRLQYNISYLQQEPVIQLDCSKKPHAVYTQYINAVFYYHPTI